MIPPLLPTISELKPHFDRLEANPASVILPAHRETANLQLRTLHRGFASSREERKTLKIAIENARQKRAQSGSRNVSGMIDERTAQKCRARYCARKAALSAPVYRSHASFDARKVGRTHHCVKTPDYENSMEGPKHLAQGWQLCAQKLRPVQR